MFVFLANTNQSNNKYLSNENSTKLERKNSFGKLYLIDWIFILMLIICIIIVLDIPQGLLQSSYSETETSSVDSTAYDSFQQVQSDITENYEFYSPPLQNVFTPSDITEQPEKRHNSYVPSSVSMQSVISNVANENPSKRPSSLPVFKQNGL